MKEKVRYCHLREDTKSVCAKAKKEEAAQERKRRGRGRRVGIRGGSGSP